MSCSSRLMTFRRVSTSPGRTFIARASRAPWALITDVWVSSDSGVSTSPRQLTFTWTRAKTRWLRLELTPIGEVCDSGIYFGTALFRYRFLLNQRTRNLRSKEWYGTGVTSALSRIGKHSFLPQRNSQSAAGIEGVAEPDPDGFFAIPVNMRIGLSGSRPPDAVICRILFISLTEDGQLKDVLTALDKTSVHGRRRRVPELRLRELDTKKNLRTRKTAVGPIPFPSRLRR